GLVGPGEVAPQHLEAVGVHLGPHDDAGHQYEHGGGQAQTLGIGGLVDVQGLGQSQTQSAQGGVAGGDGQNDDADQGDDAAHRAQDVLAHHADGGGSQAGGSGLLTQVVHAHSAGGPHHSDEALQDHHVVEGHAALLLALDSPADDSGLSGVEAGQDAAGHGDEEHGDEVAVGEVILITEGHLSAVSSGGEGQGGHPLIPDVQQREVHDEDAHEHAHGGEQQDSAEDG